MQVIKTQYFGPSNVRGSRIIASCDAGRITMSYKYALNISENHREACEALRDKLGWTVENNYSSMIGGQAQDGNYYWVFSCDSVTRN